MAAILSPPHARDSRNPTYEINKGRHFLIFHNTPVTSDIHIRLETNKKVMTPKFLSNYPLVRLRARKSRAPYGIFVHEIVPVPADTWNQLCLEFSRWMKKTVFPTLSITNRRLSQTPDISTRIAHDTRASKDI
jgi:hypothetical protein